MKNNLIKILVFIFIACLEGKGFLLSFDYPPGAPDTILKPILGVSPYPEYEGPGIQVKISPQSLAEMMGLQNGDVILEFSIVEENWVKVETIQTLASHLQEMKIGQTLSLKIQRGEEQKIVAGPLQGLLNPPLRHYGDLTIMGTYLVYLPPDYDTSQKKYPLCVILHGSGSIEGHGHIPVMLGRDDVIYIAPRAPYPHLDMLKERKKAGWTAWHPDSFEENHPLYSHPVTQYVDWVFQCAEKVKKNYRIAGDKIFIWGHSQGAGMANACAIMRPEKVASYYAYAGYLPKILDVPQKLQKLKDHQVKVFLSHGQQDSIVKPEESTTVAQKMEKLNVDITMKLFDTDHYFNQELITDFKKWLTTHVQPQVQKEN